MLLCLNQHSGVCFPGKVQVQAHKCEIRDPLYTVPVHIYWLRIRYISPKVHNYLFCFMVFETKLLSLHYDDSFSTSSLYTDSSPPLMSPTTVVSSTNFTMELLGWVGGWGCSHMCLEYTIGDLTHIPVESRC